MQPTRSTSRCRCAGATFLALALLPDLAAAHGLLTCPSPRQNRGSPMTGNEWTNWMGAAGNGYAPGYGNAQSLNGGGRKLAHALPGTRDLCGGTLANHFSAGGPYGPTDARGTFVSGGLMEVSVLITAYHGGWFEFRLAVPDDGGADKIIPVSQELLNEHVLEIDPSTPNYGQIVNYNAVGGPFKCAMTAGYADPTATSPNTLWPHGSCCNQGGQCSPPGSNTDRYIMERASSKSDFVVVLKVPEGIQCERCVLQWTYITGNSNDAYPETFWNCADVEIKPAGYTGVTGCSIPGPAADNLSPPPPRPPPGTSPVTSLPPSTAVAPPSPSPLPAHPPYIGWCQGSNVDACTPCWAVHPPGNGCPDGAYCYASAYCPGSSGVFCGTTPECMGNAQSAPPPVIAPLNPSPPRLATSPSPSPPPLATSPKPSPPPLASPPTLSPPPAAVAPPSVSPSPSSLPLPSPSPSPSASPSPSPVAAHPPYIGWCQGSNVDACTPCWKVHPPGNGCPEGAYCYASAYCPGNAGVFCGTSPECMGTAQSSPPPAVAPSPKALPPPLATSPSPSPLPVATSPSLSPPAVTTPPPSPSPSPAPGASSPRPRVVQYFANWAIYGRAFYPHDMKLDDITHVHYAFFDIKSDCKVHSLDAYSDYQRVYPELGMSWQTPADQLGSIGAFRILRDRHPHLKLAFSLGGWTKSTYFSGCARTAGSRASLVQSAVALLRDIDFDGIDVDWEYPVCCGASGNEENPSDWSNYLLLLREMRAAMDVAFPTVHKELTIAMGMGPLVSGAAPRRELGEILDAVNLMTYDYNGGWANLIAHNAPLYSDPAYVAAGGATELHVDWGVQLWLQDVPAAKLVLGLPAYGRGWGGTAIQYGSATSTLSGTWEPGMFSFWDLQANYIDRNGWIRNWNSESKVPYLAKAGAGFISYDDPESVAIKAAYAKSLGLAGMMWWEASDDKDGVLLAAANTAFGQASLPSTVSP